MTIAEVLSLLGGVGLFLFGMSIMSTGLKNSCGDNLQVILEKATTNKGVAVLVGAMIIVIKLGGNKGNDEKEEVIEEKVEEEVIEEKPVKKAPVKKAPAKKTTTKNTVAKKPAKKTNKK